MTVARQGQGAGRLPGREPIEPGMEEERLGHEQGEREQRPDDHHRGHPPESDRIREPPPRVEVANEPLPTGLARTAGDRARAASTEWAPSTRVIGMMPLTLGGGDPDERHGVGKEAVAALPGSREPVGGRPRMQIACT